MIELDSETLRALGMIFGAAVVSGIFAIVHQVRQYRREPEPAPPEPDVGALRQQMQNVESETRQSIRRAHDRIDAVGERIDHLNERIDRLADRR